MSTPRTRMYGQATETQRHTPKARPSYSPQRGRIDRGAMPLAKAITLYTGALRGDLSARGKPYAESTIAGYILHLDIFTRWVGELALRDLTPTLLTDYIVHMRELKLKPQTIATREKVVRLLASWCTRQGFLPADPFTGVRRVKAPDPHVTVISDGEWARLLRACDLRRWGGTRDRALLHVLMRCGLRAAELCALDGHDYEPDVPVLHVRHGKGDKPRDVGVPDDAKLALDDWCATLRGTDDGPLLPNERAGRLTPSGLRQCLERIALRAKVAHVHPHRFRHTFAVTYLRKGGDIYMLSQLLGHTTIDMSARYLRGLDAETAAASNVTVFRKRA